MRSLSNLIGVLVLDRTLYSIYYILNISRWLLAESRARSWLCHSILCVRAHNCHCFKCLVLLFVFIGRLRWSRCCVRFSLNIFFDYFSSLFHSLRVERVDFVVSSFRSILLFFFPLNVLSSFRFHYAFVSLVILFSVLSHSLIQSDFIFQRHATAYTISIASPDIALVWLISRAWFLVSIRINQCDYIQQSNSARE